MRKKLELEVYCCMCSETFRTEVEMPEGWGHRYGAVDDEQNGFCPRHSKIEDFTNSQCPGCVGGWGECGLWEDFAFREMKLTEVDLSQIRKGVCPRRVNGTFSFDGANFKEENLSKTAESESGVALASAILEYRATYNER